MTHCDTSTTGTAIFTGKERDSETGLDYFGARYYGSNMGRWLSPDPLLISNLRLANPQGWNAYGYALNNPTNMIDSDGREAGYTYNPDGSMSGPYSPQQLEQIGRDAQKLADFAVRFVNHPFGQAVLDLFALKVGGAFAGAEGKLAISATTRLTETEISTGTRLARQTGLELSESKHIGAEFVDAAGKSYDAMGGVKAFEHFGDGSQFMKSIVNHVNKSVDKVAIDLAGASKAQISAVKEFVKTLTKEQQKKIIYVK